MTIPGVAELLGLTLASEIGDVSRFPTARQLVGYSGLTPTIKQSGQSSRTGRISKAGPNTLRCAAVEAAQHAWRPTNPWHRLYTDTRTRQREGQPGQGSRCPQDPDRRLARARAPATAQAKLRRRMTRRAPVPASSPIRLAVRGPQTI